MGDTSDGLIYGIIQFFGLTILFSIFGMAFYAYVLPAFKEIIATSVIDTPTKIFIFNAYNKFMFFFDILPMILLTGVLIYMFVLVFRKQAESRFE